MPSFKCADIGMQCPYEVKTKTQEELMKAIAAHAGYEHKMTDVPPDMMVKIKAAIKP
jgi:predicted small metal-binding protein